MLVLSRKVGEKLLIGDDIVVTILDSRGDGVRVGIDAPRSLRVHRAEVVEAVSAANQEAAAADQQAEERLRSMLPKPSAKPTAGSQEPTPNQQD